MGREDISDYGWDGGECDKVDSNLERGFCR